MNKKAKRTLKIGLRWAVLGAIVWSLIAIIAFSVMDYVSANVVNQVNNHNKAVHEQVPREAYEAYEQEKSPRVWQD